MNETIEVQAEQLALATRPVQTLEVAPPAPLWGTSDSAVILAKATATANALKDVVKSRGLISNISGKEYPRCEAWTLLGTLLGVFPVLCWTKEVEKGWEARVEAKTLSGAIVGAAEAQCLRTERNWGNRDDFALRSMAQTRATAKALRMPLGFVMTLAGYESTPAEEMTHEAEPRHSATQTRSKPAPVATSSPTRQSQPAGAASSADSAPMTAFNETKFREAAEKWLAKEAYDWADLHHEPKAWTFAVVNGMILPTEQLAAVTWSKLWGIQIIDDAVRAINSHKMTEAGAKRAMNTILIDLKQQLHKDIEATGVGDDELRAFEAVYGKPGNDRTEPEKPKSAQKGSGTDAAPAGIPTTCPKCQSTATKTSQDFDLVSWCQKCGWQWTEGGKVYEAYPWASVICPIPPKGTQKKEYDKAPFTLGQIMRTDNKRFYGLVMNNQEAKGWTNREGKQMPPSPADQTFAIACKQAVAHFDEKKAGAVDAMREGVDAAEEAMAQNETEPPF